MGADEIRDEETLERWLQNRPQEDSICIAQRAGLRVFPLWTAEMGNDWARKLDLTALPVLRSLLTLGVAHKYPTPEATLATLDATRAARLTTDAVDHLDATRAARATINATLATLNAARATLDAARAARATTFAVTLAATRPLWEAIRSDAVALEAGIDPARLPLWPWPTPGWFSQADAKARAIWVRDPEPWDFWLRWWDGVLSGQQIPDPLQHDIALIPDDVWQAGPRAVAERIAKIERTHKAVPSPPDPIGHEVAALPRADSRTIERVRIAINANRDALPATFDAIESYLVQEVDRLQKLNYVSEEHAEECRRQIAVLCILDSAIKRLRASIPTEGEVMLAHAEDVEKLSRVYAKHFLEWPRANAGDIVDSGYRGALVAATTTFGLLCGVPVAYALGAGIVLFGAKKIGEGLKIARDVVK